MKNTWAWIIGIFAALFIIGLLFFGGSSRQAYRIARGAVEQRVEVSQERISTVTDMAMASVDLALKLSGDLPPQQAKADLARQAIEATSKAMQEVAQARGDLAIARLDASIKLFNTAMDTVDAAAQEAIDPVVKARLDHIYGILQATQEQITQLVLKTKK
jgi:hypothetical protein